MIERNKESYTNQKIKQKKKRERIVISNHNLYSIVFHCILIVFLLNIYQYDCPDAPGDQPDPIAHDYSSDTETFDSVAEGQQTHPEALFFQEG